MKNSGSTADGMAGYPKPPANVSWLASMFWHWQHPLPSSVKQAEIEAGDQALAESQALRQQSAEARARSQQLLGQGQK